MDVRSYFQLASLRHRLASIKHQVQECLLHQVRIQAQARNGAVQIKNKLYVILRGLRFRQREYLPDQSWHLHIHQVELDRTREIEKCLDHTIQTTQLGGEHVKLRRNLFLLISEFGFEQL